jgi:hypothetical protein
MKRYDEAIAAFNRVQVLDPTFPKLAANIRIAEQNRNATQPVQKKTPVSLVGVIVILSVLVVARQIRKRKK